MTDKKKKNPKVLTPRGTFQWPKLATPDTKFDADGKYSVKLVLDTEAFEELSAIIQPIFDDALAEGEAAFAELSVAQRKKLKEVTVNDWFTPVFDPDTEEETGTYSIVFGAKAGGTKRDGTPWSRGPIPCFDAKGKPVKDASKIWSGSEGKVSFSYRPYFIPGTGTAGISLQLEAVQVLELASSGGNADSYGFGVEDGYEASDDVDAPETDEAATDAASDF